MDRKSVLVLISALMLGLSQPGICAGLADNLDPNLLDAVSAMDTEAQVGLKRERPVLTSYMSIEQKKAVLEEYMLECGYDKHTAEYVIRYIPWSKVKENMPPSFYTAFEKGYIENYIRTYHLDKYFTDETIMSKMNSLIELMVSKSCSEDDINKTILYISWSEVTEDFAPSFYTALDKGYINYIDESYCAKYFTNETAMTNLIRVIELFPDQKEHMVYQTVHYIGDEICYEKLTKDEILSKIKKGERKEKIGNFVGDAKLGVIHGFIPIFGPIIAADESTTTKVFTNLNPIAWVSWLVIIPFAAGLSH